MFNKNRLSDSIQPLVSFNLLFFFLKKIVFAVCLKGDPDFSYSHGLEVIHRLTKILQLKYQVFKNKTIFGEVLFWRTIPNII